MALQQTTSTQRMRKVADEAAVGLNGSIEAVRENANKENLLALISLLNPVRDQIVSGAKFMAGYSRRHPIRMGISAVALGFLATRIWKKSNT